MAELVFVKLGGSLITDKRQRYHLRMPTMSRLAGEIARAMAARPGLRIVMGHGSGSFGHVAAQESGYDRERGHASPLAFAQVGAAASTLNHLVRATLLDTGVPTLSLPPSASAVIENGEVSGMAVAPFRYALELGIVPLTFGDVLPRAEGGTAIVSTEAVFHYLAPRLKPRRLLLLGMVEGVYERAPQEGVPPDLLPEITPDSWPLIRNGLGGSHGTDVTGGMVAKVEQMLALVRANPAMQVRVLSGEQQGLLEGALCDPDFSGAGTVIHS